MIQRSQLQLERNPVGPPDPQHPRTAGALFPLLALLGAPTSLLCLSMPIVLGIAGVLASIISSIESIDRYRLRTTTFAQSKGA